jgi:uncharacterized lipoprotein NlpE involved in copper resistance
MIKKALFTLCSAALVLTLTGCDDGSVSDTSGEGAAPLLEGVEAFKPPEPGTVPTIERPGAGLSKTTGGPSGN